jgi:hypothetical protein
MSEIGPDGSVECPICGEAFDPTAAGGWCTNTQCGEWQYTDETDDTGDSDTTQSSATDTEGATESRDGITCPGCEGDVDTDANFCPECGADLSVVARDSSPVPEQLLLTVEDTEITVTDGQTVGRKIRTALTDAGYPEDEAVRIHREHIRFVREDGTFYLHDLGENPTTLNGEPLRDREPVEPGDEIELSGVATLSVQPR